MRQLTFDRFGAPAEVLRLETAALPEPGPGLVRVRLTARPINPADLLTVTGRYGRPPALPATPGFEGVGVVDAVGTGVASWQPGQRVIPVGCSGTWAEAMVVPEASLIAVPEGLSDRIACQAFVNPVTAYLLLLTALKARPGDWVAQGAAGSAVGRMIIQLAASHGVTLVNVVRRRAAVTPLEAAGAENVLASEDGELAKRIADRAGKAQLVKAIDPVGGETAAGLLAALGYGGQLVLYGALSGEPIPLDPGRLIFKSLRIESFWLADWFRVTPQEERAETIGAVMKLLASGQLVPPVEAEYDLADFATAIAHAERPGRTGKILLVG